MRHFSSFVLIVLLSFNLQSKVAGQCPVVPGSLGTDQTVCAGTNGNITNTGRNGPIDHWEYSFTGGDPWGYISETYETLNFENIQQTTWFRALIKNPGCEDYCPPVKITVDQPSVAGTISGATEVCTGSSTTLTLSGQTGSTIAWEESVNNIGWSALPALNNQTVVSVNPAPAGPHYYRARVNNGVCPAETALEKEITVNPASVGGTLSGSDSVCSQYNGGTLSLSGQTGAVVRWESSATGHSPWTSINHTSTDYALGVLNHTQYYRAIVKSGACAETASATAGIVVFPAPAGGIVLGSSSYCKDNAEGSLVLTNFTGTISRWEYSVNNQASWVPVYGAQTFEYIFSNPDTTAFYRAVLSSGVCDTALSTPAVVIINPQPVPDFESDTVNVGETTTFTNQSTIASGTIASWLWDFDNGSTSNSLNPRVKYAASGSYNVSLTATSNKGCVASVQKIATVNPLPQVDFSFTEVCDGYAVAFANLSSFPGGGSLTYTWHFGDGSAPVVGSNPSHIFPRAGVFSVKLIAESDFSGRDSITKSITVYPNPTALFDAESVCLGVPVRFANHSFIATGSLLYSWNFGDMASSTVTSPNHNYAEAKAYFARLIATSDFGCSDTVIHQIVVNPQPTASFSVENKPYKQPMTFVDGSSVSTGSIAWHWDFGDGSTSAEQHPVYTYPSAGTFDALLRVTTDSLCTDDTTIRVKVFALPVASFTAAAVCDADTVRFVNGSSTPEGELTYEWLFGDGTSSTAEQPVHVYGSPDTYRVTLMIETTNGSRDTAWQDVVVHPNPVTSFVAPEVCDGFATTFENTTSISSGSVVSWLWDFGDYTNSIQPSPVKFYLNPGEYTVSLTAVSDKACQSVFTAPALVKINPTADFTTESVCLGYPVVFTNTSSHSEGISLSSTWDFADTTYSSSTSPSHEYDLPGEYRVQLAVVAANGCSDTVYRYAEVFALPQANAGADIEIIKGFGQTLSASGGTAYVWQPSTGLSDPASANPIANPAETTNYTVRVEDEHGCIAYDSVQVTVKDEFKLYPNNIITPDGNSQNDTWQIVNIESYPGAAVRVFNRWGNTVYQATGYDNSWNGANSNGDILPDGAYYYVITFPDSEVVYKGSLTILRGK